MYPDGRTRGAPQPRSARVNPTPPTSASHPTDDGRPGPPPGNARPQPTGSVGPLALAVRLFLIILPVGHMVLLPVGGAMATAADLVLGLVVLTWLVEIAVVPGSAGALGTVLGGRRVPALPGRAFLAGCGLLMAWGGWVALSGAWGYHPTYAVAKGLALAGFAVAAAAVGFSGLGWPRAVDAWLSGAGVAVLLTVVLGAWGPEALQANVLYGGGGVGGLPFVRVSGPFLHPNMMGDFLVVSGILLWGRWPELSGRGRLLGFALAAALGVGLFLTTSTAWISAGVVLMAVGRGGLRGSLVRFGGMALAGVTLLLVLVPLDTSVLGIHLVTSGIRPGIWSASLQPIVEAPLFGVGASPYVALAADPLKGGAEALWDAHNALLSVWAQFGLVGVLLLAAGLWKTVMAPLRAAPPSRVRRCLVLAWVAVGVNAVFMASEDLRHVWLLVGMTGLGMAWERTRSRDVASGEPPVT